MRKGYRKCTKCLKNRHVRFFKPKGRVCLTCQKKGRSKASHEARVQSTYGLEPGDWDKLWEYQGEVCFICQRRPRYRCDTDHDHDTNLVRGLLCKVCNRRLLPAARNNIEVLKRAILYLQSPPALEVLGKRYYQG